MNLKMLKSALACLVLSVSGFANAGLINIDYQNVNDNKLVFDSANNLEWLRWDLTSKVSLSDLLNTYSDFHLASEIEMLFLWSESFSVTGHCGFCIANYSEGSAFQQLFGYGNLQNLVDPVSYGLIQLDNNQWRNFGTRYNVKQDYYSAASYNAYTASGEAHRELSYALVRNTTDVPEPSTLAILALGIMGLASRRFKKKS